MQVTIELPERLARRIGPEQNAWATVIERGLRVGSWAGSSALAQEVFGFLGSGPRSEEIVAFRPSEAAVARSRELLRRNEANALTPEEEAELDELALLDELVTLIKARAWQKTAAAAGAGRTSRPGFGSRWSSGRRGVDGGPAAG